MKLFNNVALYMFCLGWVLFVQKMLKTDMLRSIGKQSGESVESVPKKKREAAGGKDLQKRKVLSVEWKSEGWWNTNNNKYMTVSSVRPMSISAWKHRRRHRSDRCKLRNYDCTLAVCNRPWNWEIHTLTTVNSTCNEPDRRTASKAELNKQAKGWRRH